MPNERPRFIQSSVAKPRKVTLDSPAEATKSVTSRATTPGVAVGSGVRSTTRSSVSLVSAGSAVPLASVLVGVAVGDGSGGTVATIVPQAERITSETQAKNRTVVPLIVLLLPPIVAGNDLSVCGHILTIGL
jgi:hypothetical protein